MKSNKYKFLDLNLAAIFRVNFIRSKGYIGQSKLRRQPKLNIIKLPSQTRLLRRRF